MIKFLQKQQAFLILFIFLFYPTAWAKTERVKPAEIQESAHEDSVKAIADAIRIIKNEYVTQVREEDLVEASINGMLLELDPHSAYYNKEASKEMELHTTGELEGIGIDVAGENGLLRIVSPIDGSPAEKAGLKAGDYIFSINDENVYGLSSHDIVQKIRGKPNTKVKVSVLRESVSAPLEFSVTREKVKLNSIKTKMLGDDIAYLRISYFYGNTSKMFQEALKNHLNSNKVKGIVVDLRNNPGGLLDQAVSIASIFVHEGDIVHTKGRNKENVVTYKADQNVLKVKNIPVAVLINNGTASAAEIVASALQDHKKAVVLGVRSFGKGSVQEVIDIEGRGAIVLTTALYYTPLGGRSIQLEGVTPDILIEDVDVKQRRENTEFREEDIYGRLEHGQNIKYKEGLIDKLGRKFQFGTHKKHSSYENKEDYMITRAVDLIKGINIYALDKPVRSSDKNQ